MQSTVSWLRAFLLNIDVGGAALRHHRLSTVVRDEPRDEAVGEAESTRAGALATMGVDVQVRLSLLRDSLLGHARADFFIVRGDNSLVLGRQLGDVVAEERDDSLILLKNRQDTRLNLAIAARLV